MGVVQHRSHRLGWTPGRRGAVSVARQGRVTASCCAGNRSGPKGRCRDRSGPKGRSGTRSVALSARSRVSRAAGVVQHTSHRLGWTRASRCPYLLRGKVGLPQGVVRAIDRAERVVAAIDRAERVVAVIDWAQRVVRGRVQSPFGPVRGDSRAAGVVQHTPHRLGWPPGRRRALSVARQGRVTTRGRAGNRSGPKGRCRDRSGRKGRSGTRSVALWARSRGFAGGGSSATHTTSPGMDARASRCRVCCAARSGYCKLSCGQSIGPKGSFG
jgi:hypothetical protein